MFLETLKNKKCKTLVLGAGISGINAAKLLLQNDYSVLLYDDKHLDKLTRFHVHDFATYKNFETSFGKKIASLPKELALLVISPGVSLEHYLVTLAKNAGVKIISEIDVAISFLPECLKIGITGTNGKSTTTMMMLSILKEAGYNAFAVGNVGNSLCEFVLTNPQEKNVALAIELSSFQLETSDTLTLDAAIFLNLTQDHLDRYESMEDYFLAKKKILNLLKPNAKAFFHDSLKKYFSKNDERVIWFDDSQGEFLVKQAGILARHNIKNAQSCVCCSKFLGIDEKTIINGLKNFTPLPHRCEFVGEKNGISFINDSKATNVICVVNALENIHKPIHLLLGGIDKQEDFSLLSSKNYSHIKGYYVFGSSKGKIRKDLTQEENFYLYSDLNEAFVAACQRAKTGDVVLLSPACASYDQYENFVQRGDHFKKLFNNL